MRLLQHRNGRSSNELGESRDTTIVRQNGIKFSISNLKGMANFGPRNRFKTRRTFISTLD